jgi:carbamoyltransferase
MRVVLGITDGDDAGAVLLVDGRLVAAVNEERLNRLKMSIGFPRLAVREVLRLGGLTPADVDHVAMAAQTEVHVPVSKANKGWFARASTMGRIRNEISSALVRPLGEFPWAIKGYRVLKRMTMGRRRGGVRKALSELGVSAPISYHEHHRCHALAAYEQSGFEDAVSISLDGGGDGRCSHVWVFEDSTDRLLNTVDSLHSIGNFYAYVTHLCGYRAAIHEGKITGLAASGEPRYQDIFRRLITYSDGQIKNVGRVYHNSAINTLRTMLPADWEHQDLAASIQNHLEDVALQYIRHWVKQSGKRNVCLSGGVFANVLLNQRIADLPETDRVFIYPAMGDGGIAAGAAFSAWRGFQNGRTSREDSFLPHAYLGAAFTDDEIEKELRSAGVEYRKSPDIEDESAALIHAGRVVARFNGGMEFGPRALGNRTIMYQTKDPSVNNWLNKRLQRTEFMPFAPACLAGHEEELFHWNQASARAARFMTITLACSDWMKEHCPAVVHVDGTARPQIVDADTNPSFHRIIKRYHERSGIPVIVNTSFNMHEEPIVCTPSDAIRAWKMSRLDNLAIGSFLVGPPLNGDGAESE